MPYFPKAEEQAPYKCPGCGGWFYRGNMNCAVNHAPGTCCHYGETPTTQPIRPQVVVRRERKVTR